MVDWGGWDQAANHGSPLPKANPLPRPIELPFVIRADVIAFAESPRPMSATTNYQ